MVKCPHIISNEGFQKNKQWDVSKIDVIFSSRIHVISSYIMLSLCACVKWKVCVCTCPLFITTVYLSSSHIEPLNHVCDDSLFFVKRKNRGVGACDVCRTVQPWQTGLTKKQPRRSFVFTVMKLETKSLFSLPTSKNTCFVSLPSNRNLCCAMRIHNYLEEFWCKVLAYFHVRDDDKSKSGGEKTRVPCHKSLANNTISVSCCAWLRVRGCKKFGVNSVPA